MKFSIGDQVIDKKDIKPHTSYSVYQVVGYLDDAILVSHYGDGYDVEIYSDECHSEHGSYSWRTDIIRFQEEELFSTTEAVDELHRLESDKARLDNEFEVIRVQIQKKMDQAAALVKEAAALAVPYEKYFCDLKRECMLLYDALNDGAWSHSSMGC